MATPRRERRREALSSGADPLGGSGRAVSGPDPLVNTRARPQTPDRCEDE